MCGIVGIYYFDPQRTVSPEELREMADRIVHRGPDDAGYHIDGNIGIGMRRLTIIFVGGAHQPIYPAVGLYVMLFTGVV